MARRNQQDRLEFTMQEALQKQERPQRKQEPPQTVESRPQGQRLSSGVFQGMAALVMAANSSTFKLAPPTNAPSISGWLKNSAALAAVTDPP